MTQPTISDVKYLKSVLQKQENDRSFRDTYQINSIIQKLEHYFSGANNDL